MLPFFSKSSSWIKAKSGALVKTPLALLLVSLQALALGGAAAPSPSPSGALPKIETRSFNAKIIRQSQSHRMYMIGDDLSERPTPGKIILLKENGRPVMAFRVIKDYF